MRESRLEGTVPIGHTRPRAFRFVVCAGVFIAGLAGARAAEPQTGFPGASAVDHGTPLSRYCLTCHNDRVRTGGLSLDGLDMAEVAHGAEVWEKVVRKLRTGTMPPPGMPRPDAATYAALATSLEGALDAAVPPDPGRPLLRRLNRAEYANVVRDLLALEVNATSLLPPDDSAFGFDNIADLLVVSPSLLERYLAAADWVSALAVGDPDTSPGSETYIVRGDQSQDHHLEGLPLGTVGGVAVTHYFPLDGEYEFQLGLIKTNLEAVRGLEHEHQIEITVDGRRVFLEAIGGPADTDPPFDTITERTEFIEGRLHVRVPVEAGPRVVAATFIRKTGAGTNRLRSFVRSNSGTYDATGRPHIETLTVTGPFEATGPGNTPSRQRIFTCGPEADATSLATRHAADAEACATEILMSLARRAYRRPVTSEDLERLLPFYREGRSKGTFETGIQLALRRLLASPSFIFRVEENPAGAEAGTIHQVTDVELASRLSFFLWSSMPDDALLALAESGRLSDPPVLDAQVRRMLADPKAAALAENFAGQWLHLRNLQTVAPNTDEFPDFDNDLREAFRREAELFFDSVVREDRNVLDLLTARDTFVNERLARHYGVPYVYGSHFRRVSLPDDARRGLLGKGSVLLATSHADRTAPVLRGKWILENLLGTPPPPPPPNVDTTLRPVAAGARPPTMRERMETHRRNPACASCHLPMDSLGFALENFDAVGSWRDRDAGAPVNASGQMTDGTAVDGVVELRDALLRRPELFVGTLTEKLMTYALGRGLQYYDMPVVRGIVREAGDDQYRFSEIVLGIVRSAPFQMRRSS